MGNFFSTAGSNSYHQEILRLEDRIKDLECIDENKDGIVTRSELMNWQQQQQVLITRLKQQINDKKDIEYKNKIENYQSEIIELKKELANQEMKKEKQLQASKDNVLDSATHVVAEISEEQISKLVDRWMADENININGFPDYIERRVYRNVIKLLLSVLKDTLETTSIEFLGHKIDNLTLRPIPQ